MLYAVVPCTPWGCMGLRYRYGAIGEIWGDMGRCAAEAGLVELVVCDVGLIIRPCKVTFTWLVLPAGAASVAWLSAQQPACSPVRVVPAKGFSINSKGGVGCSAAPAWPRPLCLLNIR